jgi:hypothetical protein
MTSSEYIETTQQASNMHQEKDEMALAATATATASTATETTKTSPAPKVWFRIKFRTVCEICLVMPLVGLVACLLIALAFQFEHIQETACKVSRHVIYTLVVVLSRHAKSSSTF